MARWHHVALVHDGDALRLYVDGTLAGQRHSPVYGVPLDTEAPLLLGASGLEDVSAFLPGLVDEVSI